MAEAFDDEAAQVPEAVGFRLSAKNLFLTYPRCDLDPERARLHLLGTLGIANILYMVIAREQHQDGTPHLHVCIALATKVNIRDPAALDLPPDWHGNYQGVRNMKQTIRYVKKDGEFIEHGTCPANMLDSDGRQTLLTKVAACVSELELAQFVFTNELSREWNVLFAYWKSCVAGQTISTSYTLDTFHPPQFLTDALRELSTSRKALVLLGPPGIGKTQYLQAHYSDRSTVRVTHLDQLKLVNARTEILILDDCELGHLPRSTVLHLLDVKTCRQIHCRYSNANLSSTLILILISNSLELLLGKWQFDEAVLRRVDIYDIDGPLF